MKLKILYVEDHADTAEVFAELLRRWGHAVTVANTIATARAFLNGNLYDLLLCDLGLPDGSGADLMREVGNTLPMKSIAVSGFGIAPEAIEAGFHSHLLKPVKVGDLKAVIESLTKDSSD